MPPDLVLVRLDLHDDAYDGGRCQQTTGWGALWAEQTEQTRAFGDRWLDEGQSALLVVPSALSPSPAMNVLLNARDPWIQEKIRVAGMEPIAPKITQALDGLRRSTVGFASER
jgi:RES domain-containing protein